MRLRGKLQLVRRRGIERRLRDEGPLRYSTR